MFGTRKLGKTSTQRKALLRQQVTDLSSVHCTAISRS